MIIGIDEVGRGAWAGPVVVAAVGLGGITIDGLTDSKLLTKKNRERLSLTIKQTAPLIGIGWVNAHDIDAIGISAALKLAASRAISQIDITPDDHIIIDGTIDLLAPLPKNISYHIPIFRSPTPKMEVSVMKKADLLVPSVSAASVVAKVARDHYMQLCDGIFLGYSWSSNVGYGAAAHRRAIDMLGITPLHRCCFEPMKSLGEQNNTAISPPSPHIQSQVLQNARDAFCVRKNTTQVGKRAEQAAADYLQVLRYAIIDRNWKTKWCEIDIVALKNNVIYFVEVKYRKHAAQGGGIAAITPKKLKQMRFAAELWLHNHGEADARLGVVEVTGEAMSVTRFEENV